MKVVAYAAVLACAISSPASAHWQFTNWGMTPEQVIASSNGSAKAGPGDKSAQNGDRLLAVGTYSAGDYTFSANFWFGPKGLTGVSLALHDDGQCTSVRRDLLAKYGPPVEETGSSVQRRSWNDQQGGNRIVLIETGLGYCELQYSSLISEAGASL